MATPPVFSVDDLPSDLPDDFREASETHWSCGCIWTFDQSFCKSERFSLIQRYLAGEITSLNFGERLRDWILWQYGFNASAGTGCMELLAEALSKIRSSVNAIPQEERLDEVDSHRLTEMANIYRQLDGYVHTKPTISSTILATLRPALFPIWDPEIASAYGLALHWAGYHRYLRVTQATIRKALEMWRIRSHTPLENFVRPEGRVWAVPLAKVVHEWNWVRITRSTPRGMERQRHVVRPELKPVKDELRNIMRCIDSGEIQIHKMNNGSSVYVEFLTDNGWSLVVFNDAGGWDFLQFVEDPNGNILDYFDMYDSEPIARPQRLLHWGLLPFWGEDPEFPFEVRGARLRGGLD